VQVVDDDGVLRDLLRDLLEDAGFAVQTFACGADLLDRADLQAPAVLLLDLQMPGMSGLALQAELHRRGVLLPVIFLTGTADIAIAVAAMQSGAADFLEKPFDPVSLIARLRRAFERHVAATWADRPAPAARPPEPAGAPCSDYRVRLGRLTPREREVLRLMVTGQSCKLMARELGGSFRTIEVHRGRVLSKLAALSLADLVRMDIEAGGPVDRAGGAR
jgi:two-component system response regulator FixJ